MYTVGDLNIDQTKYNDLHIIIKKSGMKQLIKDPTRITQTTKSIIDVIIINSLKSDTLTSGVMRCGLSDHDVVYTVRKKHKQLKKNIEVREIRNFKNINTEEVVKMIKEAPWWTMHLSNDIKRMFGLHCKIIKIIIFHIPLKKLRINTHVRNGQSISKFNPLTRGTPQGTSFLNIHQFSSKFFLFLLTVSSCLLLYLWRTNNTPFIHESSINSCNGYKEFCINPPRPVY
jgi:hypothetical protein